MSLYLTRFEVIIARMTRCFLESLLLRGGFMVQTLNNMYHRWTPEMETDFLKQHHWRKSSQWVTLR